LIANKVTTVIVSLDIVLASHTHIYQTSLAHVTFRGNYYFIVWYCNVCCMAVNYYKAFTDK